MKKDWASIQYLLVKNKYGVLIPNTSITEILQNQSVFVKEEILLQQHGCIMGVCVGRSPVAHPEIAGEEVEYVWGAGKIYYHSRPLKEKRSLGTNS
jgi:hypothetical protein